jgi:hypothetical protein
VGIRKLVRHSQTFEDDDEDETAARYRYREPRTENRFEPFHFSNIS